MTRRNIDGSEQEEDFKSIQNWLPVHPQENRSWRIQTRLLDTGASSTVTYARLIATVRPEHERKRTQIRDTVGQIINTKAPTAPLL